MNGGDLLRRRFFAAVSECGQSGQNGIGTLGEKTLHAVLKRYCQPDQSCHEVRVGRSVADIRDTTGIVEIQTRSFDRLRAKLPAFLELGPVTVVYPVAVRKYLRWMNPQDGSVTPRRKSPKTGAAWDVLPELYKISGFLNHDHFSLRVVLLEIDEYRLLDGWSSDCKKGSTRYERIPGDFLGEVWIRSREDWPLLLPEGLPEQFTSAVFAKHCARSRRFAQTALRVLISVGAVERVAKSGNAYIYRANSARPPSRTVQE